MSDLTTKIEALGKKSDKKALVKLGADELGVDLDASKTAAVLAEELLAVIEERGEPEAGETDNAQEPSTETQTTADKAPEPAKESPEKNDPEEPPEPESEPKKAKPYKGKMLKNMRNGRMFPWTAALAKSRNMKEV